MAHGPDKLWLYLWLCLLIVVVAVVKAVIDIIAAAFIMAVMMAYHRETSHPTNLNQLPKGARKKRIRACFTPYLQESSPAIEFPVGEKLGKQFQKKSPERHWGKGRRWGRGRDKLFL